MFRKAPYAGAAFVVALMGASAHAQDPQGVKELLNRAQTQSEKRAVEDLIDKLKGQPAAPATRGIAPPSPAATAAPSPVQPAAPAARTPSAPGAAPSTATAAPATPVQPAPPRDRALTPPAPTPQATTTPATPAPAAPPVAAPAAPAIATPSAAPAPSAPPTATAPATPAVAQPAATPTLPPRPATPVPTPTAAPAAPPAALPPTADNMQRAPEIADQMNLPKADLEVYFDIDSAAISPRAMNVLLTLGKALADSRLTGAKFVIGGHTDASGAAEYNLALSQRRAEAVRQFVIDHFKLAPENLIARGYGRQRLKNPRRPFSEENRRVQIINWTSQSAGDLPR